MLPAGRRPGGRHGATADLITAPWLGTLSIKGDTSKTRPLAGNFEASLDLSGPAPLPTKPVLGTASIKGSVGGDEWSVHGNVGKVAIGGSVGSQAQGWELSDAAAIRSLSLGDAINATVSASGAAGTIKAKRWQAGAITASAVKSLSITGDKRNGIAGDFGASLMLTDALAKQTLGKASVAGQITGGTWAITGNAGAIKAAATQGAWGLAATGSVKSVKGTTALAGSIQAKSIGSVSTKGPLNATLTLTGDDGRGVSLGSLAADRVGNATLSAPMGVSSIRATDWQSGSVSAGWLGSLTVAGNTRLAVPGNCGADLQLTGTGVPRGKLPLGRATVAGTLADALWTVTGVVRSLDVGRWGAGSVLAVGVAPGSNGIYFDTDDQLTGGRVGSLTIRQFEAGHDHLFGVTAERIGRLVLGGVAVPLASLPFRQDQFCVEQAADALHKGVALPLWNQTVDLTQLRTTLDNLKALGANWVEANVFWFQDDISSTAIAPDFSRWSASDASVRTVIDEIHRRGMKAMLKPMVDLRSDPGHWRGDIPGSDAWFTGPDGYWAFLSHWADIAREKGVDMLCVGTELVKASAKEAQWRALIANVRAVYSGQLVYAANQGGATKATEETIAWWDALDYIGLDAYYPLTQKADPTVAELQAAWTERAAMIETWRAGLGPADRKPVLFTEAGYRSWDGANIAPSSQASRGDDYVDEQEQADCYAALFDTLWRQKTWFAGVCWWNWEVDPNPVWEADNWYTPQGKLAEAVLRTHYA